MASLSNVVLDVTTVQPANHITLTVTCDVDFSKADLYSMHELGERYTLRCQVVRKEALEEIPVLAYADRVFPPATGEATPHTQVKHELTVPMNALHGGLIGRDDLTALVTLLASDTEWQIVQRSEHVSVELAA